MNILCVSCTFNPGNRLSDTNLIKELSKSKNQITHAIKSNQMYKNYKISHKNFYCGYPGFERSDFKEIENN